MVRIFKIWLLLCFFLPISAFSKTNESPSEVKLYAPLKQYELGTYASFLKDPEGKLSISEVASDELDNRWLQVQQKTPNFAFSDSVYWIRIGFESRMDMAKTWLFELAFPLHDYLDYYVVQDGKVLHEVKTGDRRPFHTRPFDYRNYLFELDMPAGSQRTVYLRMASHDGLHEPSPMILWDKDAFALENGIRNLGLGLFYGIVLVMAIYNLFIYFSVRDSAYLYYVGYISFFATWLFSYYGFSYQFLWPDSPVLANQIIVALICGWAFFVIQFIRTFLDTRRLVPWVEPICRIYIALLAVVVLTRVWDHYAYGILTVIFTGAPACFIGIIAGVICLRKGYRPAYYFLLAWSVLLLSIVIFCLKAAGLLPSSWLIERAVQIGCVTEVVLLSLGLADRINDLKRKAFLAQKESLKAVESNLKIKNDFITSITHELRTPMNAVIGGLQLAERNTGPDQQAHLDIVKAGANDMMRLVNDILVHTEIQAGKLSVKAQNVAINDLLEPFMVYYAEQARMKELGFSYDIDSNLPEFIRTDPDKVLTITRKLLDNAIKFTEEGYVRFTLTVETRGDEWQLKLQVQDTGPGIPEEIQSTIYEPFTQAEGGFQRRYGGVGIGLCICHNLVTALDGSITLDSSPERGSNFYVAIPVQPGEQETPAEHSEPYLSRALPVLVVEDNMVNQMVIVKMLKNLGLEALLANQGREALVLLEKLPVSMILMDLQMPVMDGFTCAQTIRNRTDELKDIPIIAVSANLMDVDKARCIESGMNDFLEKPVKLDQLKKSLGRFIRLDDATPSSNVAVALRPRAKARAQ
ncbi:MAG: 7TM diverse intracellular signaling domain-containing protein [Ketobacteraceae bacterium]|nr:7TM diverse intracellular signaling domain-containing protein [Ketobacteraceae bacterium]